jgi:hypothetical protein
MCVGVGVCAYLEESYWLIERPFVVWWRPRGHLQES